MNKEHVQLEKDRILLYSIKQRSKDNNSIRLAEVDRLALSRRISDLDKQLNGGE